MAEPTLQGRGNPQSDMPFPRASIIFPTYNRRNLLVKALESLAMLHYPKDRYEVVVVDDGSTDGTVNAVQSFQQQDRCTIRYFRQNHLGITKGRNLFWQRSMGHILVFTDDDCVFPADWLWRLLSVFDDPNIGAAGGPDKGLDDAPVFARCLDYAVTSFWGTGGVRRKTGARLARYYPRGCNMAVPRRVMEEVGGFDETLDAGEEIDLGCRISMAGYQLRYVPEAWLWHARRADFKSFLKQMYTRGYTRFELITRHRELLEPAYLIPPFLLITMAVILAFSQVSVFCRHLLEFLSVVIIAVMISSGIEAFCRIRNPHAMTLAPLLILLQHLMYAIGFLGAIGVHISSPAKPTRARGNTEHQ